MVFKSNFFVNVFFLSLKTKVVEVFGALLISTKPLWIPGVPRCVAREAEPALRSSGARGVRAAGPAGQKLQLPGF